MFEFIKAVSDTALDMINAVYHDKPLILFHFIHCLMIGDNLIPKHSPNKNQRLVLVQNLLCQIQLTSNQRRNYLILAA